MELLIINYLTICLAYNTKPPQAYSLIFQLSTDSIQHTSLSKTATKMCQLQYHIDIPFFPQSSTDYVQCTTPFWSLSKTATKANTSAAIVNKPERKFNADTINNAKKILIDLSQH